MTQITPIINEYRIQVFSTDIYNLRDLSNDKMMYPYKMEINQNREIELVYKTPKGGTTLREFIKQSHTKKSFRKSFAKHINPLDLLLKLIVLYDELLSSNKIMNQSFINPDLIWITNDTNIKIIYTMEMELVAGRIMSSIYWSPELLGKHTHIRYYNMDSIHQQRSLTRYDTRPSTMSCVYSLGLVFYYMITGHDPYDSHRVHVYERPDIINMKPIYARLIWVATDSDVKHRPTLKEWYKIVEDAKKPRMSLLC